MARVEQQHGKTLGKATDDVGSPDELGNTARESGLHRFLELGVFGRHIWLENAEGEKVPVPGSPPSLPQKEVEKGLVLEQARGRIKKGHDPAPFLPCAERWVNRRLEITVRGLGVTNLGTPSPRTAQTAGRV
jgi:hypothetical protein